MELAITDHAVQRFIKRHAPHMGFEEARNYLLAKAPNAAVLKTPTLLGQQQWQIEDPYCILVMKPDHRSRSIVCVTVLPTPQGQSISDEELEILREHLEGDVDPDDLDRVLMNPNPLSLLTPALDPEAERQRINKETKLWNRALGIREQSLRRESKTTELGRDLVQANERVANLRRKIRLAREALERGDVVGAQKALHMGE